MTRFKLIFAVFISCLPFFVKAGSGFVYLKDTATKLFFVNNNEVFSPDKSQMLYFQKGNIFFNGGSDEKDNIFLLTTSMNPGSGDLEMIYEKNQHEPSYSFRQNKFYLGKNESEDLLQRNELLHMEKSKKWLAFYASANDSLLAYYRLDSFPASVAILVAYTVIKKFELEKKVGQQQSQPTFITNSYSTIKPAFGNATANEWMWDGKVLRPRWNVDPNLIWTFDGHTVKQMNADNTGEQYSWDGATFKPLADGTTLQSWSWDGGLIKPLGNTYGMDQYAIENGVIRSWPVPHIEKEWHLDGDIPIPMIILIITGIARPD